MRQMCNGSLSTSAYGSANVQLSSCCAPSLEKVSKCFTISYFNYIKNQTLFSNSYRFSKQTETYIYTHTDSVTYTLFYSKPNTEQHVPFPFHHPIRSDDGYTKQGGLMKEALK